MKRKVPQRERSGRCWRDLRNPGTIKQTWALSPSTHTAMPGPSGSRPQAQQGLHTDTLASQRQRLRALIVVPDPAERMAADPRLLWATSTLSARFTPSAEDPSWGLTDLASETGRQATPSGTLFDGRDAIVRGDRRALDHGRLRQNRDMTEIRPAETADPAGWLLRHDAPWWDLVRFGPPIFDVYVRIALVDGTDRDGEHLSLRMALATLADHTTSPAMGYAAIWEGWTSPAPSAPQVAIPHRTMLLFTGPVAELRDAPGLAWYGSAEGVHQEPHLVWPEDRAWCLACEVDEEIEFTVGCGLEASYALARALPGAVRRVQYGESVPMYRD